MKNIIYKSILILILLSGKSLADIELNSIESEEKDSRSVYAYGNINILSETGNNFKLNKYLTTDNSTSFVGIKSVERLPSQFLLEGAFEAGTKITTDKIQTVDVRKVYLKVSNDYIEFKVGRISSPFANRIYSMSNKAHISSINSSNYLNLDQEQIQNEQLDILDTAISYNFQLYSTIWVDFALQGNKDSYKEIVIEPINYQNTISRKYGYSTVLYSKNEHLNWSAGYAHNQNYFTDIFNPLEGSSLQSTAYALGSSYNLNNFYVGLTASYYRNIHYVGTDTLGATLYAHYKISNLTPYIGLNYLESLNVYGNVKNQEGLIKDSHVIENLNLVVGLSYNTSSNVKLSIEHSADIRSGGNIEKAYINNKRNHKTSVLLGYSF